MCRPLHIISDRHIHKDSLELDSRLHLHIEREKMRIERGVRHINQAVHVNNGEHFEGQTRITRA